ncbi:RBBP9/YdeN family alpha/beta hydrolase [Aquabacterium sp.]|uniref:RBBP9/YdeN family alpha/beta hydrolase n=1 Tax=Aquabacterium sp. TaxID=1872578 RepID=UPI003782E928
MTNTRVLLLPGWLDSGPGHWQTRWEQLHGWQRVQQHDWVWPRRGDWMAQLETTLLASPQPAVLVAHSLGCHLVAAWAAHSAHTDRVRGALLVAPPDVDAPDLPPQLAPWRPARRHRLPFAARLLYSSDDPFGSVACAEALATDWGAEARCIGPRGHLNAESGLGDWPEGAAEVQRLLGLSR